MRYSVLLILFFVFLPGCKKSENNSILKDASSLIINAGFECGWGTGSDSLIITRSAIKYLYFVPAVSMVPTIKKSRNVSDNEWEDILNAINPNDFQKLDFNSCNICVDGCDEWISVKTDHFSHQIRFAAGLKIESITKLQDILAQLRSEFNK